MYGGSGDHQDEPILLDDEDYDARRQTKRARGGSEQPTILDEEDEQEVVEVAAAAPTSPHRGDEQTDAALWPEEQDLEPTKMVNLFRVNITKLRSVVLSPLVETARGELIDGA